MDFASSAALVISICSLAVSAYVAWLQHEQRRRKVKIQLGFREYKDGTTNVGRVLVIEAPNAGHRSVVLDECGFLLGGKLGKWTVQHTRGSASFGWLVIKPHRFSFKQIHGGDRLPVTLQPGESVVMWLDHLHRKSIMLQAEKMGLKSEAFLIALVRDKLDHAYRSNSVPIGQESWDLPAEPGPTLAPWD